MLYCGIAHGGSSCAASASGAEVFMFSPFFPMVSSKIAISFCSWWSLSLRRSASRFCSIRWNCSLEVPSGTLAVMSSLARQQLLRGANSYGRKPYAWEVKNQRGMIAHLQIPGSVVPGPPVHAMPVADGEAGLTEATSNDGAAAAPPEAATQPDPQSGVDGKR